MMKLAVLLSTVVPLGAYAADACAGGLQTDGAPTSITIESASGSADTAAILPVSLEAAAGVSVGSLSLRLPFPTASLTFDRVQPSGLITAMDAGVRTKVEERPGGAAVLNVDVTTNDADGSPRPIPDGPVMYLVFRIAASAAGGPIPLEPVAAAFTTDQPPRAIPRVVVSRPEVIVTTGITPCFFYMH